MTRFLSLALAVAACLAVATRSGGQNGNNKDVKAQAGLFRVEARWHYTRLFFNNVLWGTQVNEPYLFAADAPNLLAIGTQWEALAQVGVHRGWHPGHEPLTYYHRTGPVGAVFYHLRNRKDGTDGTAPVGVVGLYAGTPAAYAVRGQSVTFYESQAELKFLVADTDKHFTYLRDARLRGATVDVKFGPVRQTLAADAGRRFAVLLVELYETGFDPGDRLTLEAVRLYFDRVTPDGIVALHVSNREYQLEPVVARIARELNLVGRVWNDDSVGRPGKVAASWVVLARIDDTLGPLAGSTRDQFLEYGTVNPALGHLLRKYTDAHRAMAALRAEWLGPPADGEPPTSGEVSVRHGPDVAALYQQVLNLRERGEPDATLAQLTDVVCGRMFRPFRHWEVPLRTDAHRPRLPTTNEEPK